MKLKLLKHNQNILIVLGLLLFFFLLRQNQIFFQFKFINIETDIVNSIINYSNFYLDKQNFFEVFIYFILLIPGYYLLKSNFNFENTSIFFLYLFFFAPYIIFFTSIDYQFYRILTNEAILLEQKDLYLLSIFLYLNLVLLIFLTRIKLGINLKYFYVSVKNLEKILLGFITIATFVILFNFFFLSEQINIDLHYLLTTKTNLKALTSGLSGYLYYFTIYIFLPLIYLLEKKRKNLIFVLIIYLLLFFFIKSKIILFFMISILTYHFQPLIFSRKLYAKVIKLVLIYLIFVFFLSYLMDHFYQIKTSLFFERFFLSQTKNLFFVYDNLLVNGPIHLSHIGILNKSLPLPEGTANFFDFIKHIYGGGSAVSNSYIMDGIASFGLKGLFFVSILLTILFKLVDLSINLENSEFRLIYLFQIIGFLSFPLSTHLLTYGLGITIFLGMIKIKR